MKFLSITQAKGLKGKRVLVRGSLNVPIKNKKVFDDFRLRELLPTLDYLEKKGAKIILIGHIGRKPTETLKPVADHFNKKLGKTVGFAPKLYGDDLSFRTKNLGNGQILMIENLRRFPGEMGNGKKFAHHLASLGDVYVNDCFGVSHRKHASVVGISRLLPSYGGISFADEVKHLSRALQPKRPFLFILGGAKFETKIPLLKKFINLADTVFVGGAIVNDILEARGLEIGRSVTGGDYPYAKTIGKKKNVLTPKDVVTIKHKKTYTRKVDEIEKEDMIVDAGPGTVKALEGEIQRAKFILWNGPLGLYEQGFDRASRKLLRAISESSAISIIGGGDTVALVSKMRMENDFTFVSAGGGATLEFLQNAGSLPGITALQNLKSK